MVDNAHKTTVPNPLEQARAQWGILKSLLQQYHANPNLGFRRLENLALTSSGIGNGEKIDSLLQQAGAKLTDLEPDGNRDEAQMQTALTDAIKEAKCLQARAYYEQFVTLHDDSSIPNIYHLELALDILKEGGLEFIDMFPHLRELDEAERSEQIKDIRQITAIRVGGSMYNTDYQAGIRDKPLVDEFIASLAGEFRENAIRDIKHVTFYSFLDRPTESGISRIAYAAEKLKKLGVGFHDMYAEELSEIPVEEQAAEKQRLTEEFLRALESAEYKKGKRGNEALDEMVNSLAPDRFPAPARGDRGGPSTPPTPRSGNWTDTTT